MKQKIEQIRVFFALWPRQPERDALADWQAALLPVCGGRVMRPETLHATLVFLGGIAQHRLEALQLAAQEVAFDPFELRFDTARYWGHNHIAFAAPSDMPAQLVRLEEELEQRLTRHSFRFDRRPYKPHVTLLRNAKWSDADLPAMPEVRWQIGDFALVQSLGDEQGSKYEVLARFGVPALK